MEEQSDIALLQRLRQSDESAYTEIFHRYWEKLYAIAYNRLRTRAAAEDGVQEVLASLWVRKGSWISATFPDTWLSATRYAVFRQISRLLPDHPLDTADVAQQLVQNPDMDHLDYCRLQERLGQEIAHLPGRKCRLYFYTAAAISTAIKKLPPPCNCRRKRWKPI